MAEELDEGRVAYLEARVGELHQTIADLRAENVSLDDRRARWAEEHEKRRDELERSEASRRAWAEAGKPGRGVSVGVPRGEAMTHRVDWNKIADAVEMACEIRNVSLRDVAEEVGIAPSGLTRLRQGKHLSADGLAALVAWLFPKSVPVWIIPAVEGGDTA